jgi:uncharacterized protein involved in tolerance to divalent cations
MICHISTSFRDRGKRTVVETYFYANNLSLLVTQKAFIKLLEKTRSVFHWKSLVDESMCMLKTSDDYCHLSDCFTGESMYNGPSVIRIPEWSGRFWAKYSPVFLTNYDYRTLLLYTVRYSISALRSFTSAFSDDSLCVIYTTDFFFGGPNSLIIRNTPPPYSPDDRGSMVHVKEI